MMSRLLSFVLTAVFASCLTAAAPAAISASGSSVASAAEPSETVALASDNPNGILWNTTTDTNPQPIRGQLGGTILAQQNVPLQQQNPDLLAPPTTDQNTIPNVKWPFSLSPTRLNTGGFARQQNINQMPVATSMAGVDMRLEPGAIRELHWHKTSEWAYVLSGYTQVSAVDQDGRNFVGTVGPGDLWYFPPGIPHSLQATNQTEGGSEFLLIFDNGDFSDGSTFLLTDWLAHTPKEVIAKNFGTSLAAWNDIPGEQLYIFPGESPSPDATAPEDPQGQVPNPYIYKLSQTNATQLAGGALKIADSRNFTVSTTIALAEVWVEPGGMRELHWHPTEDEWTYYISGSARVTEFASSSTAQTFNYVAGDIGFVPASYGHYVENIGNDTLHYLEIFNNNLVVDVSLNQWLALTPPALVKEHLQISDETIAHLSKIKPYVVGATEV
ncbi:oxalate decarboxylase [Fomitopsis serialis]|uniref:oxalate decarboxylase n=1 Tax=Fomitopsis serialis TaxID=139415 RepID=UPI002008DC6A|nr:oxalate decarboxylase [Neoantrodia serialis]KAH9928870.1 oxalate decarboxylase [Neoantrodia serialis]